MNHTANHGRTSAQASSRALLGDKLILAAIAFGAQPDFAQVQVEGIDKRLVGQVAAAAPKGVKKGAVIDDAMLAAYLARVLDVAEGIGASVINSIMAASRKASASRETTPRSGRGRGPQGGRGRAEAGALLPPAGAVAAGTPAPPT